MEFFSSSWTNLLCTVVSIKLNLLITDHEWMAFRNHRFMSYNRAMLIWIILTEGSYADSIYVQGKHVTVALYKEESWRL